ncbi:MAG: hypothetical protein HC881_24460 [Leptolyngbyaceae cyanobacterium SL_7_1]|nr:hypothetical protein [Leptolyngbyaceae cyanobacterium SL_7_1]
MVTIVVGANLLIALVCLGVARRVWQFKRQLTALADTLVVFESNTHAVLYGAPEAILQGQGGIAQLRQTLQQIRPQVQQIRQLTALVGVGRLLWQRSLKVQWTRQPRRSRR